jgi:hypothetical protein
MQRRCARDEQAPVIRDGDGAVAVVVSEPILLRSPQCVPLLSATAMVLPVAPFILSYICVVA